MDKNAIKKYAVWARRELIARVSQKAEQFGITEKNTGDIKDESVNGRLLTQAEQAQRAALIYRIRQEGFQQVMEEVAYTWFNRFCALRFMEVNNYLPTRIRVFTDEENAFKPQILTEAIHMEMDGLDMDKVYQLKSDNKTEELYKYLLITQCNALNSVLPGMFQQIADHTELLLPDNLLREGSVIHKLITEIPESDWTDAVQIIGWLYQYYIAEPKDMLINARKQYKDEDIPFVTQLFTSDWIVRYMVENSLGRIWIEGHPSEKLISSWDFFLRRPVQERNIAKQIADISNDYSSMKPEDLKCIDPCAGSGHICVYMFDVLMQIYESYGYSVRDAVASIVRNNIYGLDIDERAAQLAYFSVMMKARQYDKRFFSRGIQPNVYAIHESNNLDKYAIEYFCNNDPELTKHMESLVYDLMDAGEYGAIINVTPVDFEMLYDRFAQVEQEISIYREVVLTQLLPFVKCAEVMCNKYPVVVTNPPYMNSAYMPSKLKKYVVDNYPEFKNDMFSVFVNVVIRMCSKNGHIGLLMPYVWMFISSYEKMRNWVNNNASITSLVQLEYNAFEAACVPVAALTLQNTLLNANGEYIKLSEFRGSENQAPKTLEAVQNPACGYRYTASQLEFQKIPGSPYAYWINKEFANLFKTQAGIKKIARARSGAKTGNNELFIKNWWEIDFTTLSTTTQSTAECEASDYIWFPHNKGGVYQNWYGNRELVVRFHRAGADIKEYGIQNGASYDINARDVYFHEGITWTALTSSKNSFRYSPAGCVFDSNKGPMMFPREDDVFYLLALLISPVAQMVFKILNPSMSLQNGDVDKLPVIMYSEHRPIIETLSKENVSIARHNWDSYETSWDFVCNPLVSYANECRREVKRSVLISEAFRAWQKRTHSDFEKMKANEIAINRLFIEMYGLSSDISAEISDDEVSLRTSDQKTDVICLISYAIGCIFGRYALNKPGIVFAGGRWTRNNEADFMADKDNIIPICDDEYFDDDIVGKFIDFIKVAFGAELLEENIAYIAEALGGKGNPKEIIRNYFLNDFFDDHVRIYQKRPIYWLFDSGKKNGFKCLVYLHRYAPDTIARIRTDYVHEQQSRYRTAITDLENRIDKAQANERVRLSKRLAKIKAQAEETKIFEEKIHHLADQMLELDLNNGVKTNYSRLESVLAKIK